MWDSMGKIFQMTNERKLKHWLGCSPMGEEKPSEITARMFN